MILRQAHGITVSKSLIYMRPLALVHSLCWTPENLSLKRWHVVRGKEFKTKTDAKAYAKKLGLGEADVSSHFRWAGRAEKIVGRERATFLREHEEGWPGREEIANILLDTAFQAYPEQLTGPLGDLIGAPCGDLELVEFKVGKDMVGSDAGKTKKIDTKSLAGNPDTVLLDRTNKRLIFLEMKVANKTTRYTLDQHIKYLTLNVLIRQSGLFPEFRTANLLLAPGATYLKNAPELEQVIESVEPSGFIKFNYRGADASAFKPVGQKSIQMLVDARIRSIVGSATVSLNVGEIPFHFATWETFIGKLGHGKLAENMESLRRYLSK
jgi:hypothetical protein